MPSSFIQALVWHYTQWQSLWVTTEKQILTEELVVYPPSVDQSRIQLRPVVEQMMHGRSTCNRWAIGNDAQQILNKTSNIIFSRDEH